MQPTHTCLFTRIPPPTVQDPPAWLLGCVAGVSAVGVALVASAAKGLLNKTCGGKEKAEANVSLKQRTQKVKVHMCVEGGGSCRMAERRRPRQMWVKKEDSGAAGGDGGKEGGGWQ